jgi:hypothetical protein
LGNSGDKVIATGFDDSTTEKTVDGVTYTVYAHSDANTSANAEIWIQKGITISDTNLPTIAITSNVSKLKVGESATITFTLSEVSADFDATDVVVTGGITIAQYFKNIGASTGNRARVDGGGGIDILQLEGSGLTLDLTKISDRRIQDIEVIEMTGSGDNTLKLNLDDLLTSPALETELL